MATAILIAAVLISKSNGWQIVDRLDANFLTAAICAAIINDILTLASRWRGQRGGRTMGKIKSIEVE